MKFVKYLFVKNGNLEGFFGDGGYVKITDDPIALFRSSEYNESTDHVYQIGNEVKLKVSLEPVSSYRGAVMEKTVVTRVRGNNPSSPEVTVWEKD